MLSSSALSPDCLPLRSSLMLDFDPDVMSVAIQQGALEHVQLQPGFFKGQIAHTASADSRVDWGAYTLSLLARGDLSADMVTIAVAVQGQGDWRVHGRDAMSGDIVVFPERGELLAVLPPQAQWLSVQIPRERLQAAGLSLRHGFGGRLSVGQSPELQSALAELRPVLAPSPALAAHDAQAVAHAHDQLIASLLMQLARHSPGGDAGAPLSPGERWHVVRRAEQYLEECGEPSVRIEDLCTAACTSLSRLERAFRETFGVGPRRYLTLRRLAAVRRELLRRGPDTSVTEVATRWGFFHLGRFSQDYKALFGEMPSLTTRHLS